MNTNTDYTLNFKRDQHKNFFSNFRQEDPESNSNDNKRKDLPNTNISSIVNQNIPLSTSRASARSHNSDFSERRKEMKSHDCGSRYKHLHRQPIEKLHQQRFTQRPLEKGQIFQSSIVNETSAERLLSPSSNNTLNYDPKMKMSQVTAYTNEITQNQKSRYLQQSQATFFEQGKQHRHFQKNQEQELKRQSGIFELLKSYVHPEKEEPKEIKEDFNSQVMKMLGRFAHSPERIDKSQSGHLMTDPSIQKIIGETLANYFERNNKASHQPFYSNETTIRAQDEIFVFKLNFKFENGNVVFNWEAQKNYPRPEYIERKYECLNYFVVDVFPTHILLFNDFTVQPFVYSKSLENHCIRTQLRTFIPLDDPSKAVTVKTSSSDDETSIESNSRFQQRVI